MTERPWMPLYVADYLIDTLDLESDQHGVYLILLMIAWRRDGSIPNDMKFLKGSLKRCARDMHGNRFNRLVPPILKRFFTLGPDGNFRQNRLTKELETAKEIGARYNKNNGLHGHNHNHNIERGNRVKKTGGSKVKSGEQVGTQVFVAEGTDAWKAWTKHNGQVPPINRDFGWFFPTEYPPLADAAVSDKINMAKNSENSNKQQ